MRRYLPILSLLAGLFVFQCASFRTPFNYSGFKQIELQAEPSCSLTGADDPALFHVKGGRTSEQSTGDCITAPIEAPAIAAEFSVTGTVSAFGAQGYAVRDAATKEPLLIHYFTPAELKPGTWAKVTVSRETLTGRSFYLQLFDTIDAGWIGISSREDLYANEPWETPISSFPIRLVGAALIAAAILSLAVRVSGKAALAAVVFAGSAAVFFRPQLFFYWDEWDWLYRCFIADGGSLLGAHNEHYIPIFFSWFYLETVALRSSYLLYLAVSLALHGLNCTLLFQLLKRLSNSSATGPALILTLFYAFSALHLEVLQWAFEQSILLSTCTALLLFLTGLEYLEQPKVRLLFAAVVLAFSAPLLFGNGFIALPQLALLLVLSARSLDKTFLSRAAAVCTAALVGTAGAYILYRENAPHSASVALLASAPVRHYLLVGSQVGTILRGLNLLPLLDLDEPGRLGAALGFPADGAEIVLGRWGIVISLALLVGVIVSSRDRKAALTAAKLWLGGELFIVSSFVLPSLARADLGFFQALALRYQYLALIGLALLLLPLFGNLASRQGCAARSIFWTLAVLYLTAQPLLVNRYSYAKPGRENRNYIQQLIQFRADPGKSGLQPCPPNYLSPTRSADDIFNIWSRVTE